MEYNNFNSSLIKLISHDSVNMKNFIYLYRQHIGQFKIFLMFL